jgi:ubiquitin-conjugating enzyme E2 variant
MATAIVPDNSVHPVPAAARQPVPRARHDAGALAAGYTRVQHVLNVLGLLTFAVLAAWIGEHTFSRPLSVMVVLLGVLAGWVITDFCCGVIHWAGDTWGRPDMPLIGRMFVRSFREHHVDPRAITRHGNVQLLGEQSLIAAPLIALLKLYDPAHDDAIGAGVLVGMYTVMMAAMAANVFHKWAHTRRPPLLGRVMQRMGLVISYRQHARHHCPPYVNSYCIAIGWLNPLLDRIRFWRGLEWLIWRVTGAVPREDDLGRDAALALMRETSRPTEMQ